MKHILVRPAQLVHGQWVRKNVLVIVLSAGCLIMSLLIVQQNRTISSQRDLIRSLLKDSIELTVLKMQQHQSADHR